ncbi:MAG TPA: L-histidine N(alpha)-methyltransferase [Stellaceae bacterium]|nr:L-histidine N(alpha)-methyltransferase [Stellaceae bacterium]
MPAQRQIAFLDVAARQETFADAVIAGLSQRHKAIPCRFLYDERGSALFEAICELPEYYVTRTEQQILERHAPEIARRIGPGAQLIEFGSGASIKVRTLLRSLVQPRTYLPIDISREQLRRTAQGIAEDFPTLEIVAVCADYTDPFRLPPLPSAQGGQRVGFFPGSTIGNLTPSEATDFLAGCRSYLGPQSAMLVGVDLKKEPCVLNAAYNDSAGTTAEFILNLLPRMNRELGTDFAPERFEYEAFYNAEIGRVELYIRSRVDQIVAVGGTRIGFAAGERILAEYSYKYGVEEFHRLAERGGYVGYDCWIDPDRLFSVHYLMAAS